MIDFQGRGILLDIEGTTSSISFVHDVMFPYVRQHLISYFDKHWKSEEMETVRQQLAKDDGADSWQEWLERSGLVDPSGTSPQPRYLAEAHVLKLMDADSKSTGLKSLQGLIWKVGFRSGALVADLFADVLPAVEAWQKAGIDVRIYSSGSIAAQKLFFGHVAGVGNCLRWFSGHYDTTIGSKREPASYQAVAADWGLAPADILFVSDLDAELSAADSAGLQVAAAIRPGNAPLPTTAAWPQIESFHDIKLPAN